MKQPEIFVSYSWINKKIADKIYYDLTLVGFNIIKDDHTLKYTDRISDFMQRIRSADFSLLLICDNYLKSINCMTEVMLLMKDNNIWEKLLPVVFKDAKIYEPINRISYVNFWQEKCMSIERELKNVHSLNISTLHQELKNYKEIAQNINTFLLNLKDKLSVSPEELFNTFYGDIINKIAIAPNFTKMIELIPISLTLNPSVRLNKINNYVKKYKIENSYCYSIIASCYKDLKKPKTAIIFYKKSLEFNDFNYTAWNNLGQVYEISYKNYFAAKSAYEKAITSNPDFDIPRLNLGLLLSEHLSDIPGAINQYNEILKFDENNPKAHNNLSNIYLSKDFLNLDMAEKHLIIAMNQNNLEATINYASYLKNYKNNSELAKKIYQKAKELDNDNLYRVVIDYLMQSL